MNPSKNNAHYDEELEKLNDTGFGYFGSKKSQMCKYHQYAKYTYFHGATIVDVGCGPALFYEWLLEQGIKPKKYIGIDIHKPSIDEANRKHGSDPRCMFVCEDFLDMSFQENVDVVMSIGIFMVKFGTLRETKNLWEDYVEKMYSLIQDNNDGIVLTDVMSPMKGEYHKDEFMMMPNEALDFGLKLSERVMLDYTFAKHSYLLVLKGGKSEWHRI